MMVRVRSSGMEANKALASKVTMIIFRQYGDRMLLDQNLS